MIENDLKGEFLDRLYAAAIGADDWKNVLAAYVDLIGGHAGLLNFYDLQNDRIRTLEWHNFDERHVIASDAYWQTREPWSVAGRNHLERHPELLATGFVSRGSSLMPQKELLASDWYNEFAAESLVQDCLGVLAVSDQMRGLALVANTGGRPPVTFSDEQVATAALIRADMQRAVSLHISAAESNNVTLAAQGHLQLRLPVLAIKDRQILTSNAAAQAELENGRLIRCSAGRLYAQDIVLDRILTTMPRSSDARQVSVVATGEDGRRFLAQAVRFNRLRGTLMEAAGADDPAVILVLTSLADGVAGREAALKALTFFTPVEHAIAAALINGQTIDDIARERQTSIQTIRWHLRNMSAKTGESGVKGLTRILTLLLPY